AIAALTLPATAAATPTLIASPPVVAPTLIDLKALKAGIPTVQTHGYSASNDGGGGIWMWMAGDQSANVSGDPRSAIWAAPASASSGASGAWKRTYSGWINVLWFGAKGDGRTNDTTALQAAFDYANAQNVAIQLPSLIYKITSPIT